MKAMKLIQNYYYYFVVVYLLFTVMVTIFSLHLFGDYYSFTNQSKSMDPTINSGSITIVKKMAVYRLGDIISYYQKNSKAEIVTHRIVQIGGNVYVTKGDTNLGSDPPIVLPRLIIGKVILIIPYLGYVIGFAKSAFGLWLTIIIPAIFIIIVELTKIKREIMLNRA